MDAILFNIDSATRVIVRALEHLQEEQNNLGEDGLLALVWEVIRYYGPVPTFQYCSGIVKGWDKSIYHSQILTQKIAMTKKALLIPSFMCQVPICELNRIARLKGCFIGTFARIDALDSITPFQGESPIEPRI